MRSTIIRYGLIASAIIVVMLAISWKLGTSSGSFFNEALNWFSIIIALSMIPLGLIHYRDKEQAGVLHVGEGIKTGFLIAVIPAITMGILTYAIFPLFMEVYETHFQRQLLKSEATMTPEEIEAFKTQMGPDSPIWNRPLMATIMALALLIPGLLVAVVSAFLFRKG